MFRKKQMIDVQHYITTECLAADLRGLIKGFTYDKKGNWKKRNGKTQKCSNVIGNKSKSTNCQINYTKRERPAKCMQAVRECHKDETKPLRNSSKRKQTTDASAKNEQ